MDHTPVNATVALILASALDMYAKTGLKANTRYTPKNMRLTAQKMTGKTFKARDYKGMAAALREWAGAPQPPSVNQRYCAECHDHEKCCNAGYCDITGRVI